MQDKQDDAIKKYFSGKDADTIHSDLVNLTMELRKCNKYIDIYLTATGSYDKAADMILLRILEENRTKTESVLQTAGA